MLKDDVKDVKVKDAPPAGDFPIAHAPQIGEADPPPEPTEAERFKGLDGRLSGLENTLQGLNETMAKNAAVAENMTAMTKALMAGGGQQAAAPVAPAEPKELIDPMVDPEGFRRSLGEAIDERFKKAGDVAAAERDIHQNSNRVWNSFQERHEKLASKRMLVEGAVRAEQDAIKSQGLNPDQVMYGDETGFINRVAARAIKELGFDPDVALTPEEEAAKKLEEAAALKASASRTGGLPDANATIGLKPALAEPGAGSLVEEIRGIQEKTGLV